MAEKGPTVGAKQIAMSRALGAAFLSHQVEQLEKTVVASRGGNGGGAGNWRDRRQQQFQGGRATVASQPQSRRGGSPAVTTANTTGLRSQTAPSAARSAPPAVLHNQSPGKGRTSPVSTRRRPSDEERENESGKDADVVVVDASVLVHALYQVKRWCQQGRQEVLIVPLEALNTLDLLKKGTSSLAQRARAASRILEAQVGTNSRIRVQRDDAFVFWDKIDFNNASSNGAGAATNATTNGTSPNQTLPSPEWVRRTICCAKWEATNAHITLGINNESNTTSATKPPRVVFAVLSSSSASSPQSSPQSKTMGLESGSPTDTTPVVPLPAPTMVTNKFEPRSSGTLISHWATQAGVEVLQVEASVPGHGRVGLGDDEEGGSHGTHASHANHGKATKGMGGGGGGYGYGGGHYGHGRRKASLGSGGTGAYTNAHNNNANSNGNGIPGSMGLVERPPAVMAMMEMVSSQPSNKGKVVRVLARGEKLDP